MMASRGDSVALHVVLTTACMNGARYIAPQSAQAAAKTTIAMAMRLASTVARCAPGSKNTRLIA